MKKQILASLGALVWAASAHGPAQAQGSDEPYIGDVILVGFGFCPRNFAEADGSVLPIGTNQALYSLLGTTYGGNGQTTFALPDLRGRIPVHTGAGPGLSQINPGQAGGNYEVSLTVDNLPAHTHQLNASTGPNDSTSPANASFATLTGANQVAYTSPVNTAMDSDTVGPSGQNQPVAILSPSLALRYCIATAGIYPSRD